MLCQPPCASSEIVHHLCDFTCINGRIIPLYTIRRFSAATLIEKFYQILVHFAKLSKTFRLIVETFVVANPEGDIPRFVVCPSLVCLLYTSPSPRDVEESRMPSSA